MSFKEYNPYAYLHAYSKENLKDFLGSFSSNNKADKIKNSTRKRIIFC